MSSSGAFSGLTVVAAATLIFVATMALVPKLGTELIPQLSQGEFNVDIRLPPGAALGETDRAIQAAQSATDGIEAVVAPELLLEGVAGDVARDQEGRGSPQDGTQKDPRRPQTRPKMAPPISDITAAPGSDSAVTAT